MGYQNGLETPVCAPGALEFCFHFPLQSVSETWGLDIAIRATDELTGARRTVLWAGHSTAIRPVSDQKGWRRALLLGLSGLNPETGMRRGGWMTPRYPFYIFVCYIIPLYTAV